VWEEYHKLVNNFSSELDVLLEAKKEDLVKVADEKIADAIINAREGKIKIKPGYDGVYGEPIIANKILVDNVNNKKEHLAPKQEGLDKFF